MPEATETPSSIDRHLTAEHLGKVYNQLSETHEQKAEWSFHGKGPFCFLLILANDEDRQENEIINKVTLKVITTTG